MSSTRVSGRRLRNSATISGTRIPDIMPSESSRSTRSRAVASGRRVHAGAGVAHGEEYIRAGLGVDMLLRVPAVDVDLVRLDRERAAVRHRVASVDRKVEEHLVDLTGVGANGAEGWRQDGDQLHLLSNQAAQHLVRVGDDVVQVEDPRLDGLAAAEGQQLPREVAGGLRGATDLVEILAMGAVGGKVEKDQIRVPENRRQDVVEIVGDPAGQRAKGVHLLRLPQLLLELFALGDVHQGALDDLFAGFTRDQGHVREHPYLAAVLTPQAVFEAHQPSRLTQSG